MESRGILIVREFSEESRLVVGSSRKARMERSVVIQSRHRSVRSVA